MNIIKRFLNRFIYGYDSSDYIDEDEYTENIIEYNNKNNRLSIKQFIEVARYIINYNKNISVPEIYKICNYHADDLPAVNSIIWAPNEKHTSLLPYRVIRIDHMEDESENSSIQRTLIIVKPSNNELILRDF